MTAHAKLSPSGAETWFNCAGSVAAQDGLPDETSEFAAEGTFAHMISEECLELGLDPYDFIGHKMTVEGHRFEWTVDDADDLAFGINYVRSFGGKFYGEHKVDLSQWLGPDQFGTLDRGIILPKLIIIDDLKWGRGLPVEAVENKQLMLYALGFWWKHARETHTASDTQFLLIVDQPRCSGGGGEWFTTLGRLLEFGEEARAAAAATEDPDAPRTATARGCKWCKRREAPGGCEAYNDFMLDVIGTTFGEVDDDIAVCAEPFLPVGQLTPERRGYILRHRTLFEKWLEWLHEQHLDEALSTGLPAGGLKAVEGRKSRDTWHDKVKADQVLAHLLGDKRLTPQLKTPTQVSKELTPEKIPGIEPLIKRGSKKPILVSEHDARPAIVPLEQQFDEVEEF